MTVLYRHPAFSGHDTGPYHPEHPSRIAAIDDELERRDLLDDRPEPTWAPASDEQILRVHTPGLLERLTDLASRGGGPIDPETVLQQDSLESARLVAGAAVDAVDAVIAGQVSTAYILGRPPGHHATRDRAMGFCLLNTIAIAAAHARASGVERVAILDWDVHHGNGTQDIFYERNDVLFCSAHRYDGWYFPGTGAASERGSGAGDGFTLNVPLRSGDGDNALIAAFRDHLLPATDAFRPDLILLSAGYDAHREDPLGGLDVTDEGFRTIARMVCERASQLTSGRLIAVLEGGYHPNAAARCVADTIVEMDRLS